MNEQKRMTEQQFRKQPKERNDFIYATEEAKEPKILNFAAIVDEIENLVYEAKGILRVTGMSKKCTLFYWMPHIMATMENTIQELKEKR